MHRHPDYKGLNQPQQKKIQPNNNSRTKTTEALTTWIEQKCSATVTLQQKTLIHHISNIQYNFIFSTISNPSFSSSLPFPETPFNSNPACVTAHRKIILPSQILLLQALSFISTLASLLANPLLFIAIPSPETAFIYSPSVSEGFHHTYSAEKRLFSPQITLTWICIHILSMLDSKYVFLLEKYK